jgi:hypothetical protein
MARRSKREILAQARPTVEALIATLHEQDQTEQALAVQDVLDLAVGAVSATKPFAVPVDSDLWTRVDENSSDISADLVEGWTEFLAGRWVPEQPRRARRHSQPTKAVLNVRAAEDLIEQVEAAADRLVEENGWPTMRGHKLNARQIAAQWMARKYPAPVAGESEAAAE